MMSLPTLATIRPHVALVTILAGASACASGPSQAPGTAGLTSGTPASVQSAASAPVLLSCPAGQQALMRQVVVSGAVVPQVECVSAAPMATPVLGTPLVAAAPGGSCESGDPDIRIRAGGRIPAGRRGAGAHAYRRAHRPGASPMTTTSSSTVGRRRRSWQKSALIIGSAAGAGAGVGAATGGKKGALIGAAIGGGAATVWDQVTRRQPR